MRGRRFIARSFSRSAVRGRGPTGGGGGGVVGELTAGLLANVPAALERLLCRSVVSVLEVEPQGIEDATR